jgi:hypothetical protein
MGMSSNRLDLCHDHLIQSLADGNGSLHLQACHGQEMGQLFRIHPNLNIILEPIETDLHFFNPKSEYRNW